MTSDRDIKIQINHAAADDLADDVALRGIAAATLDAHAIAVDLLSQPGSGNVYRRNGTTHRASAPGESPAVDTGALRASGSTDVSRGPTGVVGTVNFSAEYAQALETGTEHMAPRPFLSRVISEYSGRLMATFNRFAK